MLLSARLSDDRSGSVHSSEGKTVRLHEFSSTAVRQVRAASEGIRVACRPPRPLACRSMRPVPNPICVIS